MYNLVQIKTYTLQIVEIFLHFDSVHILPFLQFVSTHIWASSWENLFLPYANNKGTDQPMHLHSEYAKLLP